MAQSSPTEYDWLPELESESEPGPEPSSVSMSDESMDYPLQEYVYRSVDRSSPTEYNWLPELESESEPRPEPSSVSMSGESMDYSLDKDGYHSVDQSVCHRRDDVMKLCYKLSAKQQIQITVNSSRKGSAAAGTLAFFGGLVGGPVGIAVGGAVGGLLGYWLTRGQFKPLPQIIMELGPQKQQKLCDILLAVLGGLQWSDLAQLIALMGNSTLKQKLMATLFEYIYKEHKA